MNRRQQHERKVQIAVYGYLCAVKPPSAIVFHVPNGGDLTETQRKALAAMGELPGVADLMLLWRGLYHCLEVKLAAPVRTYQSRAQQDFQRAVELDGGRYAVVRGIDDARAALTAWGIPTREVKGN